MKIFFEFISDVYKQFDQKFIQVIFFTVLMAFTNGLGIMMLVPLLTIIEVPNEEASYTHLFISNLTNEEQIMFILFIYILLISVGAIINRKVAILNTELMQGYTRHVRTQLYRGIIYAEWEYLIEQRKSDLINAFTVETGRISAALLSYLRILSQLLVAVVQLIIAFVISVPLTLFVCLSGSVLFVVLRSSLKESKQLGGSLQKFNQKLQGEINDQLNGMKEWKSYGIEKKQLHEFTRVATKVEENIVHFTKVQSKPDLFYRIGAAIIISLFFYIALFVFHEEITSIVIIVFIFSRLWPMFSSFQNNLQLIFSVLPVYDNINRLKKEMNHAEEIHQASVILPNLPLEKGITFQEINFSYQSNNSFNINNLNIKIPPKKVTAIVGESGAGKSTVIDLLLGLLKPHSGDILVDDIVIDQERLTQWRSLVGYVPQDTFLLHTTIKENLHRFNPEVSEEEMWNALHLASAKKFIEQLPEGLDTVIGDKGIKLSGGERQRLILARAILRKPLLLVLDEATSALDNENEWKIKQSIEQLRDKMTIVLVAHRLSTVKTADHVIVLDKGRLIEAGSYDELASKENGYLQKMLKQNYEV
ncbi:ABC transporter ATP-binding protein [Metabacillus litoralis]|uniref:ABC transporter ATP-binding protein n=1 Tax=Metabacillus litoralis TaxID=152268 RepID=UPI001CFE6C8C|nr:ABC transporter ATP-binding protein [Metabacillus litoralis]